MALLIQMSIEGLFDCCGCCLHFVVLSHIGGEHQGFPPHSLDVRLRPLEPHMPARHQANMRSALGEGPRRGAADAGRGPGDDNHLRIR
jgi:hypothetical protein